jgi:hypothetical protein
MVVLRRLASLGSIVALGLFAQVVPAAASAQGPTAGSVHTTILSAGYMFSPTDFSLPQIGIFVNDTTNESNPLSGPSTITRETEVFINFSSESGGGSACFVPDNASDFTLSSDLQSASLHTTITDTTAGCQGFPIDLQVPLTVDVVWTGTGPLVPRHMTSHSTCGGFHTETLSTFSNNAASATATLTPLFTDSFPSSQGTSLSLIDNRLHIEGTSPPTCAVGGGRGGPSGSIPAGTYRTTLQAASAFLNDDATQTSFNISVTSVNSTSILKDGPSTSTNETDVQLFENSPDFFGFGCFVLDAPADFVLGRALETASLHTTITDTTASCNGFPSDFTLPLTLDITWTATGPIASIRNNSRFRCLTNQTESSSFTQGTNANATATIAAFSGPVTTSFATAGASDTTIHAEGAIQPPC